MKKVYLAGPIRGVSYKQATDWREFAKIELAKYGITGVSPMRAKEFLQGLESIDSEEITDRLQKSYCGTKRNNNKRQMGCFD